MKVCLYARVSTSDKDQDPLTQLLPLREFVKAQSWETYHEYTDHAPATDITHRTAWKELLEDASRRKFDILLVWRMDRAFRSVLDAATTLERLRAWGVGLRSYSEPWLDTTSPFGEALYYTPWPTPSWRGVSSGRGSRPVWRGLAYRAIESVGQG